MHVLSTKRIMCGCSSESVTFNSNYTLLFHGANREMILGGFNLQSNECPCNWHFSNCISSVTSSGTVPSTPTNLLSTHTTMRSDIPIDHTTVSSSRKCSNDV